MGITLGSNFDVETGLPLDSRLVVSGLIQRDGINSLKRYEGMIVYVESEAKNYQLVGGISNTDWAELSSGGSGGSGATNFIDSDDIDFASGIGSAVTYDDSTAYVDGAGGTSTITLDYDNTAANLLGLGDEGVLEITKPASDVQNQGVSFPTIAIPRAFRGTPLEIGFPIDMSNATGLHWEIRAYDQTTPKTIWCGDTEAIEIAPGVGIAKALAFPEAGCEEMTLSLHCKDSSADGYVILMGKPFVSPTTTVKLDSVDVGVIQPFGGTVVPSGYLLCDGAAYNRVTYSQLFAVIGTAYGSGNGSTTFNVPDLRGQFIRGTDNMGTGAANVDPHAASRTSSTSGNTGNNVGSKQQDTFENHSHYIPGDGGGGATSGLQGTTGGGPIGGATTSTSGGGSETRPVNVYTNFIIKASKESNVLTEYELHHQVVKCFAEEQAGQSFPDAAWTRLGLTAVKDKFSMIDETNDRINIMREGDYSFDLGVFFVMPTSSNVYVRAEYQHKNSAGTVKKSKTIFALSYTTTGLSGNTAHSGAFDIFDASPGDYVEVYVDQNSGAARTIDGAYLNCKREEDYDTLGVMRQETTTPTTNHTITALTSGSGTYTVPAGVKYISPKLVGGGGGGGGSGTGASGGTGGTGGNTTFGTSLLVANGGPGAYYYSTGAESTASISSPANGYTINGGRGNLGGVMGGQGGSTPLGAGGSNGLSGIGNGMAGPANSGVGGGGGGSNSGASVNGGAGGSAGAYLEAVIPGSSEGATYTYSVGAGGAGGAAGTNGRAGGAGASGIIIITEYYY